MYNLYHFSIYFFMLVLHHISKKLLCCTKGVEQGGKSPSSLKFNFFFSLLPTFSPYFSLLPTLFGPFLPPPNLVWAISPSSQPCLGHFFLLPILPPPPPPPVHSDLKLYSLYSGMSWNTISCYWYTWITGRLQVWKCLAKKDSNHLSMQATCTLATSFTV